MVMLVALLATMPAPGVAAQPEPPCTSPPYRAFDFWVGEWSVSGADGQQAGRNVITREQQGCLLVERWNGVQGGTGMSMNFYDPGAGQWRQIWVSPGAQIEIAGGMANGSMVLEGTISYLAEERTRDFRGTWTALPDGRVRQFFEERDPDAGWKPWFEGFYAPAD